MHKYNSSEYTCTTENQNHFIVCKFQIYQKWQKHHDAEYMWIVNTVVYNIYIVSGTDSEWGKNQFLPPDKVYVCTM